MTENTHYFFQNPNTGYPMLLTNEVFRDGRFCVRCAGDGDIGEPSTRDEYDADQYEKAARTQPTLHDAALHLYSHFGCKDILS